MKDRLEGSKGDRWGMKDTAHEVLKKKKKKATRNEKARIVVNKERNGQNQETPNAKYQNLTIQGVWWRQKQTLSKTRTGCV